MKAGIKIFFTTALSISFFGLNAQELKSFDKIRVASNASVNLIQGQSATIVMEDESTKDASGYYRIDEHGWLIISGNPDDEINVTVQRLEKIEISGTGRLETEGVFNSDSIELNIVGVGKLEMFLQAKTVKTNISGAGKIELEGSAEEMIIEISGSGKINAENMKVQRCTANISGSGKCLVNVSDELNTNISGSGSIYYATPPAKLNSNVTGAGKVGDINTAGSDTTRITMGNKKIWIIDEEGKDIRFSFKDGFGSSDKLKSHWPGFEMGICMLMDKDFTTSPPKGYEFLKPRIEKSIAVNFNIADLEVDLLRKNIMLVTGIGFSIHNYRFDSDAYLAPDTNIVTAIGDPSFSLSKNKLVNGFINVPVLLEFNTSQDPHKTFHFAFGVINGVRVTSRVKLVEDSGDNEVKSKIYDDFNTNPFRVDATVRLGYRNLTIFGSYGMLNFFRSDKDPELHAFITGIRFIGW